MTLFCSEHLTELIVKQSACLRNSKRWMLSIKIVVVYLNTVSMSQKLVPIGLAMLGCCCYTAWLLVKFVFRNRRCNKTITIRL